MTEPSRAAIEAALHHWDTGLEIREDRMATALTAALSIERKRWEEGVRKELNLREGAGAVKEMPDVPAGGRAEQMCHADCDYCAERLRVNLGLMEQNRQLREALSDDRSKWSFDTLLAVGDALLEKSYPEGVPLISEGDDPGPRLVQAVRDCRKAMQER